MKKAENSLKDVLKPEYSVECPRMPNEEEPEYETWKIQIEKELGKINSGVILVGHSVGRSVLVKYLSEEDTAVTITGFFLIAPPYDESVLQNRLAAEFSNISKVFFYHSRDDEFVPFTHFTQYAEKLPKAIIRKLDGCGHQFYNDLSDVIKDIKKL